MSQKDSNEITEVHHLRSPNFKLGASSGQDGGGKKVRHSEDHVLADFHGTYVSKQMCATPYEELEKVYAHVNFPIAKALQMVHKSLRHLQRQATAAGISAEI